MGENGREPSLEEIAKRMELPLEEVSRAMDAIAAPISLYDPVYSDGGDPLTVMDQVRDTKNTDERWIELHCPAGCLPDPVGAGKTDPDSPLLRWQNPDGGGGPGGHLPGPGLPPREKRHWDHSEKCDGDIACDPRETGQLSSPQGTSEMSRPAAGPRCKGEAPWDLNTCQWQVTPPPLPPGDYFHYVGFFRISKIQVLQYWTSRFIMNVAKKIRTFWYGFDVYSPI